MAASRLRFTATRYGSRVEDWTHDVTLRKKNKMAASRLSVTSNRYRTASGSRDEHVKDGNTNNKLLLKRYGYLLASQDGYFYVTLSLKKLIKSTSVCAPIGYTICTLAVRDIKYQVS
jgi:hypothetical protein